MSSAAPVLLPVAAAPGGHPRAGRHVRPVLVAALTAAGLGALLFAALALGDSGRLDGTTRLPTAGAAVEWGLPLVTLAGRVAAVGTIGTLLFAGVLLPARGTPLPPASRRALRAASGWAWMWTAATAVGALLTLSRLLGTPPTSLSWGSVRVFVEDTGAGQAALLVVALGIVLGAAAARSDVAGARLLLVVGTTALVVPVVLSGHSSGAEDHLLAVTTLGVHVVAATAWVGGLLALLVHGRRDAALGVTAARFSRLALVAFLATAVSGVLVAWLVLARSGPVLAALGTGYGALLIAKTAGLVLLGAFGWAHRRRTLPRLRTGDRRSFRRFAAGELLVMLATVTLAVALAASPPPASAAAASGPAAGAEPAADPMAGHDHGELSVGVLVDDTRFHVAGPVAPGSRVTVHNGGSETVTLTAADGSFDVAVPPGTLTTFLAPQRPGEYPFASAHSASFADVLVVR